ncbi:DUF5996 family protein [Gordonia sinesedis]
MSPTPAWPALRLDDWSKTRETLHMWLQIIGKIELVSTSLINHWWNVTYEVSARGLRTRLMHDRLRQFDAEFDFVNDELVFRVADGTSASVPLTSQSVADFYAAVNAAMAQLSIECRIFERPNEVTPAIPFPEDTELHTYDAAAAHTYWQQLLHMERVFSYWRACFAGKDSPVQVFWGSMDLSCARYSGRPAPPHNGSPPNCPQWVMNEAEDRENASAGYWPGGSEEGSFYAYTYPEPDGYRTAKVSVGYFDDTLGEWILPYETVRTADDPDATLLTFLNETYSAAADLAKWDRKLFDVDPHRFDKHYAALRQQ